jgi:hypothetical protein
MPDSDTLVGVVFALSESHANARRAQRSHGRARAGELADAHQQYNGGKSRAQRISLLAAIGVVHSRRPDGRLRVVSARRVVSGNVTRAVMLSFVDNELAALYRRIRHCRRVELERRGGRAPGAAADSHRRRVVTLMDNAAIRKSHQMLDAIAAVGGTHVFVPPYSPDVNPPIEGAFSDTKRWLRRHRSAAAGHDDITTADVQQAWDTAGAVSVAAVLGRFRRAGYRVPAGY